MYIDSIMSGRSDFIGHISMFPCRLRFRDHLLLGRECRELLAGERFTTRAVLLLSQADSTVQQCASFVGLLRAGVPGLLATRWLGIYV